MGVTDGVDTLARILCTRARKLGGMEEGRMIIPPSTKRKACQNLYMRNEASHSLNMGLCDNLMW